MDVLKKFGRYFLLDQIDQGGMAEIYRARMAAKDGGGKILVVKRMIANYGSNDEFIQMFKAEIRVTMGLIHPHIVQVYDFGEEQNQPFIAMEFVDGQNLRRFYTRFNELKQNFPVDLAAYVIETSAAGLHYAHNFRDPVSGEPANIIHRDISPQNIMVSYEGSVKVIDFGIAKATTQSEATRAGVIKGKPSYLSPEQISGEVLDARSDVFALGIVLWELLVGKKLFQGENDLAVLRQIESCQAYVKPPSTFNPKVPKELDYIVLKALAKQREKRFQSMEELQRSLHKFLIQYNPDFNPSDLGHYAKDLFKNEILESRKKLQRLFEKAETLLANNVTEALEPTNGKFKDKSIAEDSTMVSGLRKRVEFDAPDVKVPRSIEIEAPRTSPGKLGHAPSSFNAVSALELEVGPEQRGQTRSQSMVRDISSARRYSSRGTKSDIKLQNGGSGFIKFLFAGAVAGLIVLPKIGVEFPGSELIHQHVWHDSKKESASEENGSNSSRSIASLCNGAASGVGCVSLRFKLDETAKSADIYLQKQKIDPTVPLRVPVNTSLELSATRPDAKPFSRTIFIDLEKLDSKDEWVEEIALEIIKQGKLTLHTRPSAIAETTVDGKKWIRQTPFENEDLPVGVYTIRIANDVLNLEKTVTVQVREDRPTSLLEIKLEAKK